MGKGLEQTFLQRRHITGQQVYEKMFNVSIANQQENANQNHNKILPLCICIADSLCYKAETNTPL